MRELPDRPEDLRIKECIDEALNFCVIAGAGSGKTGSLIKALNHIRIRSGDAFRAQDKKVACITYTNAAVRVIRERTYQDDLFHISTIHSFIWGLIKGFSNDIRSVLINEVIPGQLERAIEKSAGKSKEARRAAEKAERLRQELLEVPNVRKFKYDEMGRRSYSKGSLDHDDVIDIGARMISKFSALQRIIGQRYPYIFIDEAQDMFPVVMDALNKVAAGPGLPIVGYFGDPMQQIYDDRAGGFYGPEGAVVIKKEINFRCSRSVVSLLNAIRPDPLQVPAVDNAEGSVELRLIKAEPGEGERNTYSEAQLERALNKYQAALDQFGWKEKHGFKQLFLTRQMIAHRLGFSALNKLFTGKFASLSAQDSFKDGTHFALKPFLDALIPIMEAVKDRNEARVTQLLRTYSPLLDPDGEFSNYSIRDLRGRVNDGIAALSAAWEGGSLREILLLAREHGLVVLSEPLWEHLMRQPRDVDYDEELHEREKSDWLLDRFFECGVDELVRYRHFLLGQTPFDTQHGVKGDEFERVVVIFDDTEANWSSYSFSKLLTPSTVGKEAGDSQRRRSLNLVYVCFSRAILDLKIVLFTQNPANAKQELADKGLFSEDQIVIHAD